MGAGHAGGYGQGGGGYGQGGGYQPMGQTPGSPDYTGCNRCGSLEHKGADCPRNPRNRQQGGYQQGGYQRFQGRFGQGGGGGYQRFQGQQSRPGTMVRVPQQAPGTRLAVRQSGPQPGQVFVVNDEGQMVPQGAQGADGGNSEASGGNSGPRTRKGAQQRARDIVREGLGQLRDWGSEIVAEVRVLQANKPTSFTKTTATEAGGGTVQSQGAQQGWVRDHRTHEGASTWMVRAAPGSILGRSLSRNRHIEEENEIHTRLFLQMCDDAANLQRGRDALIAAGSNHLGSIYPVLRRWSSLPDVLPTASFSSSPLVMDPPPQPQRSATRSYSRATDTM